MESCNLAPLGKKGIVTDDKLLGQYAEFLDIDYSSTDDAVSPQSQMKVIAMLMRNETGGTLAAGTICTWDATSSYGPGRAVAGTAGATSLPAGVVDPWISSAVADNEFFWLIVFGPCKFLFTTGTTLDEGDLLAVAASGRVQKATVGTTSDHYTVGHSLAAVDTAIVSGTLFRGFANFKFGGGC